MVIDTLVCSSAFNHDCTKIFHIIVIESKPSPEIRISKVDRKRPTIIFKLQVITERYHSLNKLPRRWSKPLFRAFTALHPTSKGGRSRPSGRQGNAKYSSGHPFHKVTSIHCDQDTHPYLFLTP